MWHYWGFRAALWLTARVPRWLGYRVAALGGQLYFWLNPGHSHKAVENYAIVLADDASAARVRLMARRSFRNYAKSLYDFFRQTSVDPDLLRPTPIPSAGTTSRRRWREGRGIVLVTPHFGNWDLAVGTFRRARLPLRARWPIRFSPPAVDALVRGAGRPAGTASSRSAAAACAAIAILRRNRSSLLSGRSPAARGRRRGLPSLATGHGSPPGSGAVRATQSGRRCSSAYVGRRPGDRTFFGGFDRPGPYAPSWRREADIRALTQGMGDTDGGSLAPVPRSVVHVPPDVAEYERGSGKRGRRNLSGKKVEHEPICAGHISFLAMR